MRLAVVIPAAGSSARMQAGMNKVFIEIAGKPILIHTLENIAKCEYVGTVFVVVGAQDVEPTKELLQKYQDTFPEIAWQVLAGGSERQYSVFSALKLLKPNITHVAVHDGARPFITKEIFSQCVAVAQVTNAAIVAVPCKDTIKRVQEQFVDSTLERNGLYAAQTPQVFTKELLLQAYEQAKKDGFLGTDDASLVERLGVRVAVVNGESRNFKITTPDDLIVAQAFMQEKSAQTICPVARVGQGYDVHALVPGRELILGGVKIPYEFGLAGHSDADVLLHAIKDAILGACSLGDIGDHFPDTSEQYKDVSSLYLLKCVHKIISQAGYQVCNVDALVMAEQPKLAPYKQMMRANIAQALQIDIDFVNVKATTTEKLGFVGRREGMAAQAVATVLKK